MVHLKQKIYCCSLILFLVGRAWGQFNTVGLVHSDRGLEGYVLFTPMHYHTTYLINRRGEIVRSWQSRYLAGLTAYLHTDGTLFRAGRLIDDTYLHSAGAGGIIEQFDWEGNLIWEYRYSSPNYRQHHDFEVLPNGNVLVLAWEKRNGSELLNLGRTPGTWNQDQLWAEQIVEVQPEPPAGGMIAWKWSVWDHLIQDQNPIGSNYGDITTHPEKINVNFYETTLADWIHGNALEYNAELDQILISSRTFNELWIIDHSTTTEEAKTGSGGNSGKGGDLLWRWGNPESYGRGSRGNQKLFGQHGPHWETDEKNGVTEIWIFNNGLGRTPKQFSSIDRISLPIMKYGNYPKMADSTFAPAGLSLHFVTPDTVSIFSPLFSSVQKLNSNHFLTCAGTQGTIMEYDNTGALLWKYINPVTQTGQILRQGENTGDHQTSLNPIFNAIYYPADFPGFADKNMIPKGVIEGELITSVQETETIYRIVPNPVKDFISINSPVPVELLEIFDCTGQKIKNLMDPGDQIKIDDISPGMYFFRLNQSKTFKMIIQK